MAETAHHGLYVAPDGDPNTVYTTGAHVQRVTDTGSFLFIEDPQLGAFTLGGNTKYGKVVYELMTTPGMRRTLGVSQLCKDEASATIPNTALFTRHCGMVALAGIAEHFADRTNMSEEDRVALLLATALDDRSHMDYSHALELKFQGWGGSENHHESLWPRYAVHGGELDVIKKHGIKVDRRLRMEGVQPPLWATESAPDLDLDRLQYTVAELLLWFDHDRAPTEIRDAVRSLCSLDNFVIDNDGHLAFKEKEMALLFSKGYLLLSTEHWNDPVNRMQLYLLVQAAQRLVIQRRFPWMDDVDNGLTRRPEWYYFGVDQDIVSALHENHGHTDPTLYAIHGVLNPIASTERRRFSRYKQPEFIRLLMDEKARDYPSEHLEPKRVEFGIAHPAVSISMSHATQEERTLATKMPVLSFGERGEMLYTLYPLKNRQINPRVRKADGSSVRLSEIDENYASLLRQQQLLQDMKTTVELVLSRDFRDKFVRDITANDEAFDKLAGRPDFTADQKRRIIEAAGKRATDSAIAAGRLVKAG